MILPKIAICKPAKHTGNWVFDLKHILHRLTFGVILFDHVEPDGRTSFEHHKDFIIYYI